MASKPLLVGTFLDASQKKWKVYHAKRSEHLKVFVFEGKPTHGMTFYDKREIWVDTEQKDDDIYETTMHECGHVACRALGIEDMIAEAFIEKFCLHVADYMCQLRV